jgi:precorrin-3B methylase
MLPPSLVSGKIIERYGDGEDGWGAQRAVALAMSGYAVALISSGDPCLFGLAPIALERAGALRVNLIPGVSAAQAAAKAIGAPYANGLALLSLSGRHQPWESTLLALEGAERGGVTVALCNPANECLAEKLTDVRRIFSNRRLLLVRDAGREGETVSEIAIDALDDDAADAGTVMIFLSPGARELRLGPDSRKMWLELPIGEPEPKGGHAG